MTGRCRDAQRVFDNGRLRFAINPEAARRSGVQISSKLLTMAMLVHDS